MGIGFDDLIFASKKKKTRKEIFLAKMEAIVPFELCLGIIRPFYAVAGNGRQPIELEKMFRMYLVQNWYNTSDEATEDLIYENAAVRAFVGISLSSEDVPDETTLWRFKDLLVRNGLTEKIFEAINSRLEEGGILCKAGTIVDATIIEAPSSTKNKNKKRDPEMSSTKKNNRYHFGMKSHIGVDSESGLVHTVKTTTAKVPDIEAATELLHGDEEAIFGDAGYVGLEKRDDMLAKFGSEPKENLPQRAKKRGKQPKYKPVLNKNIKILTNKRRMKIEAMSDGEEKTRLKAEEKAKSKVRSKVEWNFRYAKQVFGFRKTRVRGLTKNHATLVMLYALTNLYRLTRMGVIRQGNGFTREQSTLLQKINQNT